MKNIVDNERDAGVVIPFIDEVSESFSLNEENAFLICEKYDASLGGIVQEIMNIKNHALSELSNDESETFLDNGNSNVRYTIEKVCGFSSSTINYYNCENKDSFDIVCVSNDECCQFEIMMRVFDKNNCFVVNGWYDKDEYSLSVGMNKTSAFSQTNNGFVTFDVHVDKNGLDSSLKHDYEELVDSVGVYADLINKRLGDARKLEKK